jgi:anti-sigma factor RsiW
MTRSSGPSPRCRALLREVSGYLNGDLSPDRCRAIQRHLESCRACAAITGRLRKTIEACRAARTPLPRDVRARAKARIRELLARGA